MDVQRLRELLDDFKHGRASEADVLEMAVGLAAEIAGKDRGVVAAHKRMLYEESARRCGWTT